MAGWCWFEAGSGLKPANSKTGNHKSRVPLSLGSKINLLSLDASEIVHNHTRDYKSIGYPSGLHYCSHRVTKDGYSQVSCIWGHGGAQLHGYYFRLSPFYMVISSYFQNAMSTVSETDPEDSFPLMPDSKYSGGAYYYVPGTSHGAESRTQVIRNITATASILFILTASRPVFKKFILLIAKLGRPDHDNQSEVPDSKTDDVFLKYMDGLSPTSCRYVVHYKEAVRERQRMRLFTTYWELEETNRLCTLLMSLYAEADLEFHRSEQETRMLLKALVTRQSLSHAAADVGFLTAVRQCNKTSLQETDTQLDLLKDHIKQRQPICDMGNTSNCVGDSPIIIDN
ncbi:hypothetical protein DFH29DRAFT_877929 [Suillus ampliporus]|nr:hypothetical protein DFH29DRAFT_877929 [Suillus ampliporus]